MKDLEDALLELKQLKIKLRRFIELFQHHGASVDECMCEEEDYRNLVYIAYNELVQALKNENRKDT